MTIDLGSTYSISICPGFKSGNLSAGMSLRLFAEASRDTIRPIYPVKGLITPCGWVGSYNEAGSCSLTSVPRRNLKTSRASRAAAGRIKTPSSRTDTMAGFFMKSFIPQTFEPGRVGFPAFHDFDPKVEKNPFLKKFFKVLPRGLPYLLHLRTALADQNALLRFFLHHHRGADHQKPVLPGVHFIHHHGRHVRQLLSREADHFFPDKLLHHFGQGLISRHIGRKVLRPGGQMLLHFLQQQDRKSTRLNSSHSQISY